jgi:hypothetical protein
MYWILLENGEQITGGDKLFDQAREDITRAGGIRAIGLTDGLHLMKQLRGADGYLYQTEAVTVMENAVGVTLANGRTIDAGVAGEEISAYYLPASFTRETEKQIGRLEREIKEAREDIAALIAIPKDEISMKNRNAALVNARTRRDRSGLQIEELRRRIEKVRNEGGVILTTRLTTSSERFTPVSGPALGSRALTTRPDAWVGTSPLKNGEANENK